MAVQVLGSTAEFTLSAEGLTGSALEEIASALNGPLGDDPSIAIGGADGGLRFGFAVARVRGSE